MAQPYVRKLLNFLFIGTIFFTAYSYFIVNGYGTGTVWYARDGGGNATQCTGTTNATYPGSGSGVACAFSNPGYALGYYCTNGGGSCMGQSSKMVSGDTLYIDGDSDITPGTQAQYAVGSSAPWGSSCGIFTKDCTMGAIPAGTSGTPTSVIGTGTHKPYLWGSGWPWQILNIGNYITAQWLEITDHDVCGYTSPDIQCTNGSYTNAYPDGIEMSGTGIILTDVYVHGFARYGIATGNMGSATFTRTWVIGNSSGGITVGNNGTTTVTGTLTFNQPIVEWNGCIEKYPLSVGIENINNYEDCYGQGAGGYGDGLAFGATGNQAAGNWNIIGPGSISFNMQDGFDELHGNATGTVQIDKMRFEGNAGNQVKMNALTGTVTNSVIIGDCGWWNGGGVLTSSDQWSNTNWFSDICRAQGNTISYFTTATDGNTYTFYNNTILGNGAFQFLQNNTCDSTNVLNLKNNIIYGGYWISDSTGFNGSGENRLIGYQDIGGTDGDGTGCSSLTINEDYNLVDNTKNSNQGCNGAHDKCGVSPGFVNTILTGTSGGTQNNFYSSTAGVTYMPIASNSAAVSAGVTGLSFWNNALDYYGNTQTATPTMGAEITGSLASNNFSPCFFNSDCSSGNCSTKNLVTPNVCVGSGSNIGDSLSGSITMKGVSFQ